MRHGSNSGYAHFGCRCAACVKAHRDYMRDYQRRVYKAADRRQCALCCEPMPWSGHGQLMHRACRHRINRRMRRARDKLERAAAGTTGRYVWTQGVCGRCGTEFCHRGTSAMAYCGRPCMNRAARDRRRARQRCAYVADVSPARVFAADGWRCHRCGRKTDQSKTVPHPRAPTVDHLVPLALGGTHEPANCRTAHFKCNYEKGDRLAGDQFALQLA